MVSRPLLVNMAARIIAQVDMQCLYIVIKVSTRGKQDLGWKFSIIRS